jgi:hypothetical protein
MCGNIGGIEKKEMLDLLTEQRLDHRAPPPE